MHEILGIGLVLFCIPLILPSWKWIAGCTAAFFFLSVAVYVQHRYIVFLDSSSGSSGEVLGIIFFILYFLCLSVGAAIKLIYFSIRK